MFGVDDALLGTAISAGVNFFGKAQDRDAAAKVAASNYDASKEASDRNFRMQVAAQETANQQWRESFETSKQQFERNLAKQEEFAKMGIQWKVQDALAAGLHPLYALGGGSSLSPAAIVGASTSGAPTPRVDAALRSAPSSHPLSGMGQDISRAMMAAMSVEDRQNSRALSALSLERAGLENDLLRSQIARTNSAPSPGMPAADPNSPLNVPGQPQASGGGRKSGSAKVAVDPAAAHQEAGAVPDIGYAFTANGRYAIVPGNQMKERIEDSPYEWSHFYRQVKNHVMENQIKGPYPAPPGHHWQFYPDEMSVGLVKNWRNLLPDNPFFNIRTNR